MKIRNKRTKFDPNEIIVENQICRMKLYNNKGIEVAETIFDLKYKNIIEKGKWHLTDKGYVECSWINENNNNQKIRLHQAIIYLSGQEVLYGYEIDHKDTNGLNNLEENLRICTRSQNIQNIKLKNRNTSGYKGVWWHKLTNKWTAQITINYKKIYLGLFDDKKDAAISYNTAALQYHGEFAQLNKI